MKYERVKMDFHGNYEWISNLALAVQSSYNSSKFSDLSVHSHGRIISVSGLVLASQSELLKDIITGRNPATTLEEILEPFTLSSVECFLKSLYKGRLEHPGIYRNTLELYQITTALQVGWLFDDVIQYLRDSVSCGTVFDTLTIALDNSDPALTRACDDILSRNLLDDVALPTDNIWWELPREIAVHVLSLPSLRAVSELDVFVHVLYWIERNISVSNRDECVDVLECVRVFSVPHVFREGFLYPYISIVSQKYFLALKYPQLNRWRARQQPPRTNTSLSPDFCTEFTIAVLAANGREDFRKKYYNSGCSVRLEIELNKLLPFTITLESEKRYEKCYVWFKSEESYGMFPLGERSILTANQNENRRVVWNALDHIELRRLFSTACIRIGFILYHPP